MAGKGGLVGQQAVALAAQAWINQLYLRLGNNCLDRLTDLLGFFAFEKLGLWVRFPPLAFRAWSFSA